MPDLPYLRKLLGDAWVDAEVLGDNATHLLGLWQRKNPKNPWVKYTEELARAIITSEKTKFKPEVLAHKLKAEYVPTLAEMESAEFLAQQGFEVTIEPTAPEKGPDLQADSDGVPYFVEVRAVGFSEEEHRVESVTKEIFARLGTVPSSYHVHVEFGEQYAANTPELKRAIDTVIDALGHLKEDRHPRATLYYSAPEKAMLNIGGDMNTSLFVPRAAAQKRYKEVAESADWIARLEDMGAERQGTAASAAKKLTLPLQPVKTHERLRKILQKKKNQLPKDSRGILMLETSELFMLDDFSVETALYGDLVVEFPAVKSPCEKVGELTARRNTQGFFRLTSRVSAVVIHKRVVEDGQVKSQWKVYPTNRANADTIQLTVAELRRFGDLEDRDHLSAENVHHDQKNKC